MLVLSGCLLSALSGWAGDEVGGHDCAGAARVLRSEAADQGDRRELHVSRNTVRKVLRSEETAFAYEREKQPLPRIGPWRDRLDAMLLANEGKAARERLTLIRMFEELRGLGYDGGYDAVRRYARGWRRERGATTAAGLCAAVALRLARPTSSTGATRSC